MTDLDDSPARCWICGCPQMEMVKAGDVGGAPTSQDFAITNSAYGRTGELYRCRECGFVQCPTFPDALAYYEALEDPSYEAGRSQRARQSRQVLQAARPYRPSGRLLDVGAGSGILVEQALELGYDAEGIEPSGWLQSRAAERGLPVHRGALPGMKLPGPYDVVTLVDVIEHVPEPRRLIADVRRLLAPEGIVVVVTPDVDSVVARMLGWKWWHYRVAHIGYFSRTTLAKAFETSGFCPLSFGRPSWWFTADYLADRLVTYLPGPVQARTEASFLRRVTVRLNLRDSILAIFAGEDLKG